MPLYEFACTKCGHVFEELVLGSKSNLAPACPECGAGSQRKLSTFAAQTREACGQSARSCDANPAGGGCCGGACPHSH